MIYEAAFDILRIIRAVVIGVCTTQFGTLFSMETNTRSSKAHAVEFSVRSDGEEKTEKEEEFHLEQGYMSTATCKCGEWGREDK